MSLPAEGCQPKRQIYKGMKVWKEVSGSTVRNKKNSQVYKKKSVA